MNKKYCQLDSNGVFVGMVDLDESPLEPGVYMVPAHAVDAMPPIFGEDEIARWNGQGWDVILKPGRSEQEKMAFARATELARTIVFANAIRERIAGSRHYLQAARWPIQLAAAQAIKAGNASEFDTSIMYREARLRGMGETVDQLADKVLANSLIFASVGAAVDGIERATLDAIDAYAGSDPSALEAMVTKARIDAHAELIAIYTPMHGEAQAEALVAQIIGA